MNKLSVMVADDEPLVRETLTTYLAQIPEVAFAGECKNGREVLKAVSVSRPDVLLLDIHMPELTGLEALKTMDPAIRPLVIFITAYDEYALKAFELHAIDYLLKPVEFERLEEALAKARRYKAGGQEQVNLQAIEKMFVALSEKTQADRDMSARYLKRILVKENKKYHFVPVEEIYFFEGAGDSVLLHKEKSKHFINESLTSLEGRLDPNVFIRIHRSTIVNVNFIQTMQPYFNSELHITLKNGAQVKLSRNYRDRLNAFLTEGDAL
jgi:two-component system, LytTR family, response regulator